MKSAYLNQLHKNNLRDFTINVTQNSVMSYPKDVSVETKCMTFLGIDFFFFFPHKTSICSDYELITSISGSNNSLR